VSNLKEKIYKEGKFYDKDGKHIDSITFEHEIDSYSKTMLLERGWKSDLIVELLGQPDELKENAYDTKTQLYRIGRVVEAEKSETFKTKSERKRKKNM